MTAPVRPQRRDALDEILNEPAPGARGGDALDNILNESKGSAFSGPARGTSGSWGDDEDVITKVGRHVTNAVQGLPGAESALTALMVGSSRLPGAGFDKPLTWTEAYQRLEEDKKKISPALRFGEQIAGAALLLPEVIGAKAIAEVPAAARLLGKTPAAARAAWAALSPRAQTAVAGAALSAADPLLSAAPNKGIKERATEAAIAAPLGGLLSVGVGEIGDFAKTLGATGRALLPEALGGIPTLGKQYATMRAQQKAVGPLYDQALATAARNREVFGVTPELKAFLREPDIAQRIAALREKGFQGVAADNPRMLDALVKSMGDDARQLEKGLAQVEPSKANVGRYAKQHVLGRRAQLINLMESSGVKPPIMFDVPAQVHVTEPVVKDPGRREMLGPMQGGQRGQVLPGREETIAGPIRQEPLSMYTQAPPPSTRDLLRAFPDAPLGMHGPGGPGFVLRAQPPEVVRPEIAAKPAFVMAGRPAEVIPGSRIETPAMRVQTAPAEVVPSLFSGQYRHAFETAGEVAGLQAAAKRGRAFARAAGRSPSEKDLKDLSIEAITEWAQTATPTQTEALLNAALKASPGAGSRAVRAGGLLSPGLGFLTGGKVGAVVGALTPLVTPAARVHALRKVLDPLSTPSLLRFLGGVNAAANAALSERDRLRQPR